MNENTSLVLFRRWCRCATWAQLAERKELILDAIQAGGVSPMVKADLGDQLQMIRCELVMRGWRMPAEQEAATAG